MRTGWGCDIYEGDVVELRCDLFLGMIIMMTLIKRKKSWGNCNVNPLHIIYINFLCCLTVANFLWVESDHLTHIFIYLPFLTNNKYLTIIYSDKEKRWHLQIFFMKIAYLQMPWSVVIFFMLWEVFCNIGLLRVHVHSKII